MDRPKGTVLGLSFVPFALLHPLALGMLFQQSFAPASRVHGGALGVGWQSKRRYIALAALDALACSEVLRLEEMDETEQSDAF